ncbi:hypothetical protein I3843_08G088900 [Carya illinoinensis]|uniref:DUF761 domain-containing protein n=1 Tax=Carya illinoinensis TaxID=32201 RepID=A0A922JD19_CARIL|nr:hypothetical protein I3842_08G092600 [Carya illinoinensis]KAG7967229.1 hypothetical protein I3843_08G088900 [Carya illinoinensis]
METKSDTIIIFDVHRNKDSIPDNIKTAPAKAGDEKKKRGPMNLLRAASFIFLRSKKLKPSHVDVASNGESKRQSHVDQVAQPEMVSSPTVEHSKESCGFSSPMSRSCYGSASSCSEASTSRHASAVNLQELDRSEDIDDGAAYANCIGDEMIDAKAEVFIAQFYQQMRLQRMDSIDRRYHERTQRSIG